MKELVGKLSALDPEAGDALKVVTYFDTLMDGHVSIETLVRGAATLAGAPVQTVDADRLPTQKSSHRRRQAARPCGSNARAARTRMTT
jgi:hypothetical protein